MNCKHFGGIHVVGCVLDVSKSTQCCHETENQRFLLCLDVVQRTITKAEPKNIGAFGVFDDFTCICVSQTDSISNVLSVLRLVLGLTTGIGKVPQNMTE